MENKRKKQNSTSSSSPRALTLILSAAAVGVTLLVLPFSHPRVEKAQLSVPSVSPTPMPTAVMATMDISLSATPVPKRAIEDYPAGAMDLIVNGTVVCTLSSGEEAASLPEQVLRYWAELPLEKNEFLVSAQIDAEIVIAAPCGEGILMSRDDAFAYLKENPSLLPVLRVTRLVDVEETALPDQENTTPLLPPGISVIRKLERPAYMLFYTEKEYEGLTLLSKSTAPGFLIGSAATGRITETGEEPDPAVSPAPTHAPGSLAKECAVPLSVPVKGTVTARYGRDDASIMHYGIDYSTESGYAVYAPGDGIVIYCAQRGALGYVIEIRHEDTGFVSRLIGMDPGANVELYQRVKRSDRLGKVAAAPGRARSVLRYELLKDGIPVDPFLYIK